MRDFDKDYYPDPDELEEIWPTDESQKAAEAVIRDLYENDKSSVYYSKQLWVKIEKQFFHWVTNRAIEHLKDIGELSLIRRPPVNFYIHHSNRYAKRKINAMAKIIKEYSQDHINKSCGKQAENLFCLGFSKRDFRIVAEKVNMFGERKWTETGHDLDFIIERDKVPYGCEVKNTFSYIDKKELDVKIKMCKFLEIRPLFIMRYAPKSWINEIYEEGGMALIFETKIFELSQIDLVNRIKSVLSLPAICSGAIPEGIKSRFENWHNKQVSK